MTGRWVAQTRAAQRAPRGNGGALIALGSHESLALALHRILATATWQVAFERWSRTRPRGSVAVASPIGRPGISQAGGSAQVTERERIWIGGESRWRHEVDVPGRGVAVKVVDGIRWWSFAPGLHAISNQFAPGAHPPPVGDGPVPEVLNPRALIDSLSLIDSQPDTLLGRAVDVVRATATDNVHPLLPKGADGYEFVIDRELGIALRLTASLDRRTFSTIEVTKLTLDEVLAPHLFRIELPAGISFAPPPVPPQRSRLR